MRTTINLDDDVAAAVKHLRQRTGMGLSEALNHLARAGLTESKPAREFRQRTTSMGLRIDVRNIGEALELLEGPTARS